MRRCRRRAARHLRITSGPPPSSSQRGICSVIHRGRADDHRGGGAAAAAAAGPSSADRARPQATAKVARHRRHTERETHRQAAAGFLATAAHGRRHRTCWRAHAPSCRPRQIKTVSYTAGPGVSGSYMERELKHECVEPRRQEI